MLTMWLYVPSPLPPSCWAQSCGPRAAQQTSQRTKGKMADQGGSRVPQAQVGWGVGEPACALVADAGALGAAFTLGGRLSARCCQTSSGTWEVGVDVGVGDSTARHQPRLPKMMSVSRGIPIPESPSPGEAAGWE